MDEKTIMLNDGTVFPGEMGEADGILWVWLYIAHNNQVFSEIANVFSDPIKTSRITFTYGHGSEQIVEDYIWITDLVASPYEDKISIRLRKRS